MLPYAVAASGRPAPAGRAGADSRTPLSAAEPAWAWRVGGLARTQPWPLPRPDAAWPEPFCDFALIWIWRLNDRDCQRLISAPLVCGCGVRPAKTNVLTGRISSFDL